MPIKPLGRSRKGLALAVLVIGCATFDEPLVRIDPPVLDRAKWSAREIAQHIYSHELPVQNGSFDRGVYEITVTYVLIGTALIALFAPGGHKAIRIISTVGCFTGFAKYWDTTFSLLFFGSRWGPQNSSVRLEIASYVLPWVLPVLLIISLNESMDDFDS